MQCSVFFRCHLTCMSILLFVVWFSVSIYVIWINFNPVSPNEKIWSVRKAHYMIYSINIVKIQVMRYLFNTHDNQRITYKKEIAKMFWIVKKKICKKPELKIVTKKAFQGKLNWSSVYHNTVKNSMRYAFYFTTTANACSAFFIFSMKSEGTHPCILLCF